MPRIPLLLPIKVPVYIPESSIDMDSLYLIVKYCYKVVLSVENK